MVKDTAQLDRIESAILGNGHEGLIARTARIEEQLKTTAVDVVEAKDAATEAAKKAQEACTAASGATEKLMVNIVKLEKSVEAHHATEHLSNLMRKKEFWTVIVVGFIVLHIISSYVPSVWDWLMILVGLPKLILPIN